MATTGQIQIVGLNNLLRDLRKLDKEAQDELRTASKEIATRLMVPAYQDAADQAGPWGAEIAPISAEIAPSSGVRGAWASPTPISPRAMAAAARLCLAARVTRAGGGLGMARCPSGANRALCAHASGARHRAPTGAPP